MADLNLKFCLSFIYLFWVVALLQRVFFRFSDFLFYENEFKVLEEGLTEPDLSWPQVNIFRQGYSENVRQGS